MELSVCRWRGNSTIENHHRCSSPKLLHGPAGVRDDLCSTCYLRDHPPPPLRERVQLLLLRMGLRFILRLHAARRLLRFALALARHALAGFPRATDAEVAARDAICGPCCWRNRERDICTRCGCNLGGMKHLPNKKRMAKEQCPLWDPVRRPGEYWGPVPGETIWRRLWLWLKGV